MANTGYRINPILKKVSNDGNETPLDINNMPTSISGLPQDTMPNPTSATDYRVRDGNCAPYRYTKQADFQRNNCSGSDVGTYVTHTEVYTSTVSEADAEAIAAADDIGYNSRGQAEANTDGTCESPFPPYTGGIIVIDMYVAPGLDCCIFVDTPGAVAAYRQPCYRGNNFFPNDGTTPRNCWLLASDLVTTYSTSYRFEVNMARLLATYPLEPEFIIKVKGRATNNITHNGAYSLKGAEVGWMTMSGSPGSYVPTTASSVNLQIYNYSGKAIIGGADGSIGVNIGADILTFRYDVEAKTLTLL